LNKKLILILALVATVVIPFSVFAAASDAPAAKAVRGFFGIDTSKLTDQQKADIKNYSQKMADLQKEFINKMVENGSMTREQGDTAISKIDDMNKGGSEAGFLRGFGGVKGFGRKEDFAEDFNYNKIDTSKLTDQQKSELSDTVKKMADAQNELISKMIANGLLTKEQGDSIIKKIDEVNKNNQNNGYGLFMRKGCFERLGFLGFLDLKGINPENLTEQQKADLLDYSNKMGDLQKELVNKMVAAGLITNDQGDKHIERINEMQNNISENGFPNGMRLPDGTKSPGRMKFHKGMEMKKGPFDGTVKQGKIQ